jgi:transcriptional regulator with XRE-family HTH domain
MARYETDETALRLGAALARLRRDRGLSQAEAGTRAGMTSQGWGLYEAGKRPGLFRPDVQRRLTQALDATPEALALHDDPAAAPTSAVPARGVNSRGRAFVPPVDSSPTRRMQISNDDLWPWASSGVTIEYEPGRWPRQGQGCVVETTDGRVMVRIYHAGDGHTVSLRGGPNGFGSASTLRRSDIRTVSAVIARWDG